MHAHYEILTAAITSQGGGWAAVRLATRETLRFALVAGDRLSALRQ